MIKKASNLWHKKKDMSIFNSKQGNNIRLSEVMGFALLFLACILLCNSFLEENILKENLASSLSILSFLIGMLLLNFSSKKTKP